MERDLARDESCTISFIFQLAVKCDFVATRQIFNHFLGETAA